MTKKEIHTLCEIELIIVGNEDTDTSEITTKLEDLIEAHPDVFYAATIRMKTMTDEEIELYQKT